MHYNLFESANTLCHKTLKNDSDPLVVVMAFIAMVTVTTTTVAVVVSPGRGAPSLSPRVLCSPRDS